jgi:hypothetical protein
MLLAHQAASSAWRNANAGETKHLWASPCDRHGAHLGAFDARAEHQSMDASGDIFLNQIFKDRVVNIPAFIKRGLHCQIYASQIRHLLFSNLLDFRACLPEPVCRDEPDAH